MYDTTIAAKLFKQLESFGGRISPHFHKPVVRFIGDMIYGIMAEKDVKLSSIVRALKEKTTPKKVVEGYITRWRVEDTIRHVKQSYSLEDMRLFKYGKIKALAAIVLATISLVKEYSAVAFLTLAKQH